jgi:succinate CoA transferase
MALRYKMMSAEEAAELVENGHMVTLGGFTYAGAPKAVPLALAKRAKELHKLQKSFKIKLLSGASIGDEADNALAEADALEWRAPYQSALSLRESINDGRVEFVDMHLSEVAQTVEARFFGSIDTAVVEASKITPDGKIYLTSGIGNAPTFLKLAKKIIVELNAYHSPQVSDFADIYFLGMPPHRHNVPIDHAMQKIGVNYVQVDPDKIAAVVKTDQADTRHTYDKDNPVCAKIADNVVRVLLEELAAGRIPSEFLPLQSGVGNINNAVMKSLGEHPDIPPFLMFSEVLQDAVVPMMENGKVLGASASSLTVAPQTLRKIYDNIDYFKDRIVLRPQDISNHPELIRRLGVIALNVALECDIYGHANSTHIAGVALMNGIGGSGDFERNAYLSILMVPSTAKGGKISSIVPMCTHVDHSEHSVKIIVTEQGIADLRGLSPVRRAEAIIENCAYPNYRDYLRTYLSSAQKGHVRHNLDNAFELHRNLLANGRMLDF